MSANTETQLYIGEGFEGPGANLAPINGLVGPRDGPACQRRLPGRWRRLRLGMLRLS